MLSYTPKLIGLIAKASAFAMVMCLGVIALVVLVGPKYGYQYAVVKSGSMTPTYPVGTIVMTEPVKAESIKVGDVISWQIPGENKARVSHRVVEVVQQGSGLAFRTKGDANEEADQQLVASSSLTGRVIFSLPQAATFTSLLEQRDLAFGLVLVCGVTLIGMELDKVFRELRAGRKGLAGEPAMLDGVIRDYEFRQSRGAR
jgi:signal peptidase